jgi:hypothetical protein
LGSGISSGRRRENREFALSNSAIALRQIVAKRQ